MNVWATFHIDNPRLDTSWIVSSTLSIFENGLLVFFWLICGCFKPTPFIGWMYYTYFPLSVASIFTILMAYPLINTSSRFYLVPRYQSFPLRLVPFVSSGIAYPRSCSKLLQPWPRCLPRCPHPFAVPSIRRWESVPPPPSGMACALFWPKLETLLCSFGD